jgi:hypothetical protein
MYKNQGKGAFSNTKKVGYSQSLHYPIKKSRYNNTLSKYGNLILKAQK